MENRKIEMSECAEKQKTIKMLMRRKLQFSFSPAPGSKSLKSQQEKISAFITVTSRWKFMISTETTVTVRTGDVHYRELFFGTGLRLGYAHILSIECEAFPHFPRSFLSLNSVVVFPWHKIVTTDIAQQNAYSVWNG